MKPNPQIEKLLGGLKFDDLPYTLTILDLISMNLDVSLMHKQVFLDLITRSFRLSNKYDPRIDTVDLDIISDPISDYWFIVAVERSGNE